LMPSVIAEYLFGIVLLDFFLIHRTLDIKLMITNEAPIIINERTTDTLLTFYLKLNYFKY
jgi:hypothetical protein